MKQTEYEQNEKYLRNRATRIAILKTGYIFLKNKYRM